MKALANMLGILDVKQAPGRLKTDELVPVISTDGGWAGYELITATGFGAFGVGEADITGVITGEPNNPGDPVLLENNAGSEVALLGLLLRVNFNAVAAAANAGKYLNCDIYMNLGGTFFSNPGNFRRMYQVSVANPVFAIGLGTYQDPASGGAGYTQILPLPFWVPAGVSLQASIYFDDGSTFLGGGGSAGWTYNAIGIKTPKGVKPPSIP